jgi:hypothetical protein
MLGCSVSHRFPVCSSGANLNRRSSSWQWDGTCVFHCRTVTWRSCSPSGACTPITPRCGAGSKRYAPELQRCLRRHLKPTNDSWRVDETYIRVKGKWRYLYRAVDLTGATLDFLLLAKQDAVAAKRFQSKSPGRSEPSRAAGNQHRRPRRVSPAVAQLSKPKALSPRIATVPYLNNVLEQDHRAIKRRVNASQHFRSFLGALGAPLPATKRSI